MGRQIRTYQNPIDVLDQALEIIREQLDLEGWMIERRDAVAAHIGIGFARFAQAQRGELIDGDAQSLAWNLGR